MNYISNTYLKQSKSFLFCVKYKHIIRNLILLNMPSFKIWFCVAFYHTEKKFKCIFFFREIAIVKFYKKCISQLKQQQPDRPPKI